MNEMKDIPNSPDPNKLLGENLAQKVSQMVKATTSKVRERLNQMEERMRGPLEKGFQAAKLEAPPEGSYEGVDLSILPKYICYKAALLKEKATLTQILLVLAIVFIGTYGFSRFEISTLHKQLREKEYILAPGVLDFTTASPQSVPDRYIEEAASDFLSSMGNVNAQNIDEEYASLKRFMTNELRVKFEMETTDWIRQVKEENISQILSVNQKEIKASEDGNYRIVALARADFYAEQHYLGHEDQVIEMTLTLSPPEQGKRWYLKITSLTLSAAETFKTRKKLTSK